MTAVLDPAVEEAIATAASLGGAFVATTDVEGYAHLLACLMAIVDHSVPLMIAARAVATDAPCDARLAAYLGHHIEEELGHDEWLRDDLTELTAVHAPPVGPPDRSLHRAITWHWHAIAAGDPWPLVGHMWALESRPPARGVVAALRQRLGLSAEVTRTLDRHADADPHHADELAVLVRELDRDRRARVELGARVTATAVARAWLRGAHDLEARAARRCARDGGTTRRPA